jgi:hypothetical protein
MTRAFFAFPDSPQELRDVIEAAGAGVRQRKVQLTLWPQMNVFGAWIPEEVRNAISRSQRIFVDVTIPNLNVYYEMGLALGLGLKVGPVVNSSFEGATERIKREGLFDNLGYRSYENSRALREILERSPRSLQSGVFRREINFRQPLFFLDTEKKTDFRNAIVSAVKKARVFYRSFDPVETPRFSSLQAIGDISASAAVIIPILGSHIAGFEQHNFRAAFVAGLATGLGRRTLILRLRSDADELPVDYRDDVKVVGDAREISETVICFAQEAVIAAQNIEPTQLDQRTSALRSIWLGAVAAENEFRTLSQYFVETAEFARTLRGEVKIVTGRKGSGKSAIFFQTRDKLRKSQNNVVVDLKPESHQLQEFRENLGQIIEVGVLDHTIAAFWHYVLASEILLRIVDGLRSIASNDADTLSFVNRCLATLGEVRAIESGDFTSRLNSLARYFVQETNSRNKREAAMHLNKITNTVYSEGLPAVRKLILEATLVGTKIIVLFDNIDKGWPSGGLESVDTRVVRLLLESLVKIGQEFSAKSREFQSTVFLRNDIFELLIEDTPDRGKSGRVNIDWTDREKLRQVILRRLQASTGGVGLAFDQLWYARFPKKVGECDSFDYFLDHSLMRPRFLIAIIELAIANAVNRGHAFVQEDDCQEAVRQHAHALLDDFGFEIRDVSKISFDVLYAFVGAPNVLTSTDIIEKLMAFGLEAESAETAFHLMLWYGVIGVESTGRGTTYIYDVEYKMRRLQAAMKRHDYEDRFRIHPALYAALQ